MATTTGNIMIVGHAGTLSVGGSTVDCIIATFEPTHEFDEFEFKDGVGELQGLHACNERLRGRVTFRPYKTSGPAVPATPAPYAAVVLAGFSLTAGGSQAGRSYINGNYIYKGNWAPRYVAGEIVEVSLDVFACAAFPAQS